MDKMNTKNKILTIVTLILIVVAVFLFYVNSQKKLLYVLDADCAKSAVSFVDGKDKNKEILSFDILQSKFNKEKNSCFVEFASGGITFIYDLTHNKQLALLPANAGQLYSDISGGETSDVRIEYMRKFSEVKNEIFGSLK